MENCIFCKIIKGEIPCHKVYEDENCLAFLDINPVSSGHTLLIPKKHHKMLVDTPDELLAVLMIKVKKLMRIIKTAVNCDYVVLSVIGIDVPHFHIHLIPRFYNDGLANFWSTKKYDEGEAEKVTEKIKEILL